MAKRITVTSLLAGLAAMALLAGAGCGPDTELTGTPIPNSLPDTRVTARPPDVLESGFVVQFYWSANDPDGRIDHYQWKMSDNGTDGISVQDTLTFDPVTGDTLNPWFETLSSDSTFLVTADIPDFPGDPDNLNRSYQTHTFWVRAVDEDGGVDPTPAMVSFTSTTLLPTVRLEGPTGALNSVEAGSVAPTATFTFKGNDADFTSGLPTKVRYLWKRALLPNGSYARTRYIYEQNLDYLASFDDSLWTDWIAYDPNDETRRISLPDQQAYEPDPNNPGSLRTIYYLFAIQAQDTAGAVSINRSYSGQVANVRINESYAPQLIVVEQFLGAFSGSGPNQLTNLDIAAGQELNFSWVADASGYNGEVASYRYGWDITDVNDPADPNWAVLPGNSIQHRRSPPRSFASGVHVLTVQVEDNSGQVSRRTVTLNVVPVPDPESQLPLLYVDDVIDQESQAWTGPNGEPRDQDQYRDEFWLATLAKVAGFDGARHYIDTENNQPEYRDVVEYRSLLWAAKWLSAPNGAIASQFRPFGGSSNAGDIDQYVWLQPYQATVGNVLMASSRGLNAFLAESVYELPIVFESREGNPVTGYAEAGPNAVSVRRGFGYRTLPDGSEVLVGPLRYPYLTMGIATLDIMSPVSSYTEFNTGLLVSGRRKNACVSMKGLRIDPGFKATYMPSGGVFPDTIWTNSESIDWQDVWGPKYTTPGTPGYRDPLDLSYVWSNDEFYDADIVGRGTNYNVQNCDGVNCVEPIFRSISRYDWVQQNWEAEGHPEWPDGFYGGQGQEVLTDMCGANALSLTQDRAITNDQVVAFIARKTAPNKPSQVGDVVMGFDPYRMDNSIANGQPIAKVIHWVLGEHFGLSMNP
jgi:hypothetical protein